MKFFNIVLLCLTLVILLTACGSPKNANTLLYEVKSKYGDCTLISTEEKEDGGVSIIVHDTLQDFDYRVSSYMSNISIDGSILGKAPGSSDNFEESLYNSIMNKVKDELNELCNDEKSYRLDGYIFKSIYVYADTIEEAKDLAEKCAKILNQYNLKHRLDEYTIYAAINSYYSSKTYFGSINLSDLKWTTFEDEKTDSYIKWGKKIDSTAKFIKKETKTFEDVGIDLKYVIDYGISSFDSVPDSNYSPVEFYYFKTSSGKEFYVCDFLISYGGVSNPFTNYYGDDYNTISSVGRKVMLGE